MSIWGQVWQFVLLLSALVALLSALFWARSLERKTADAHRKLEILRSVVERQLAELGTFRTSLGEWQQHTDREFRRVTDALTVVEGAVGLPTGREDEGRENGHA